MAHSSPHAAPEPCPDLLGRLCHRQNTLAREKQVNVRVIPIGRAIDESIELAHEIFNRVFRKVPEKMNGKMR